jgi:glycosyltransferase involved in cell wall biosynthesis
VETEFEVWYGYSLLWGEGGLVMDISIVVPCYNEEEALPFFYEAFSELTEQMREQCFELILVDDGSHDRTLMLMERLASADSRIRYLAFSRNFGKEAAIYAGLRAARGAYVALMDADLQDPPSLLPEMYKAVTEDGYDSVATRRVDRQGEPSIRSFFARLFYRLMNRISKTELVDGARDYRLMNRKFVNALLSFEEYNRFSKGLFGWVGFKTKWLEYENVERVAGETKWSFFKLLLYAVEGIIAFSTVPLVIATVLGILCCLLAFGGAGFIILRKIIFGDPIQGWASTISILLLLGGAQLLAMGILGQYLAKTYLETKKRPVYIVKESNLEGETDV